MDQDQIRKAWRDHRTATKTLKGFAQVCANSTSWDTILYIIKINERGQPKGNAFYENRADIFNALRSNNIASPSMHWPYLSIASEGSLAITRLVVPKLMIWDFRTGKRLN